MRGASYTGGLQGNGLGGRRGTVHTAQTSKRARACIRRVQTRARENLYADQRWSTEGGVYSGGKKGERRKANEGGDEDEGVRM